MLNLVVKIYVGVTVEGVRRAAEGLTDDERKGFRSGRGCVKHIFTLDNWVKKHERRSRESK